MAKPCVSGLCYSTKEKTMRGCDDGYPSCRRAEAGNGFCKTDCTAALQKELNQLLDKREKANEAHIARTTSEGRTRARTTTHNARIGQMNERIISLRNQINSQ